MTRLISLVYAMLYLISGCPYNITASWQKAFYCFSNLTHSFKDQSLHMLLLKSKSNISVKEKQNHQNKKHTILTKGLKFPKF